MTLPARPMREQMQKRQARLDADGRHAGAAQLRYAAPANAGYAIVQNAGVRGGEGRRLLVRATEVSDALCGRRDSRRGHGARRKSHGDRKQTFEAGMSELEALTERLAEGDMTLDETMKTYESGRGAVPRN
ncbi:MAG: exodeoxyribonuclease VII small subunit [Christensenellales bacterium]